jgi:hypothetical protein
VIFFASDFDRNLNNEWTTTVGWVMQENLKKTKSLPLKMVPTTVPNDRFLEKIFRKKLIRIVAWLDLDLCVFLDYLSWIIFFVWNKKKSLSKLVFFFSRRFTLSVYCCVWRQKTVFFYLLFFVIDDISVVICVWQARKEEFFFSFVSFNRIKSLSHLQLGDKKKWTIRCE